MLGHPISVGATHNSVQCLPDKVQSRDSLYQRRSALGDVRVFIITKRAGVTRGMVGQHAPMRTKLEDVQPIAPETVKPSIRANGPSLRMNRDHFQMILHYRDAARRAAESDLDRLGLVSTHITGPRRVTQRLDGF